MNQIEKLEKELIGKIGKDLKESLSEKRYKHCLGVMKQAGELASRHGADVEKAMKAGLLHDVAKEMSPWQSMKYARENKIMLDRIEVKNPSLLHAKIGASIAKNKYHLTRDIQDAIKYHTTGNVKMDKLAKIVYVADKTEINRTYLGVDQIRRLAWQSLDEAVLTILEFDIKKNIDKGRLIHLDSVLTRNKLVGQKHRGRF